MKRRNRIEIVPVWRERIDHRLYVRALVAFAQQLAREGALPEPNGLAGGEDEEAPND